MTSHHEESKNFEQRKRDHIRWSLDEKTQALGLGGFDQITLIHEALPEINFSDVSISQNLFDYKLASPFFISCMTAGHKDSETINLKFAQAAQTKKWAMGVGSQRRELNDEKAKNEWSKLRQVAPDVPFFGNIGLAQLIQTPTDKIEKLVQNIEAQAMFVHLNPLQECLQKEGTTDFRGGLEALKRLCQELSVPVIVKETGTGFSSNTLEKLKNRDLWAVDVSGMGGTHWGRLEGLRADPEEIYHKAAKSFQDWGISTVQSVKNALQVSPDYQIWASGGVRSGVDGAKLLALGAQMVGAAMPLLKALENGHESLLDLMELWEFELRVALFCTGSSDLKQFQKKKVWK